MIRVLLLCLLASPALAQTLSYPPPANPFVTDLADLLSPEAEARLTDTLQNLRTERGTELTVVTIGNRSDYGPHRSIESFATGLFNRWQIGDAARNDGILFLVARNDREMRIELGGGYGPEYDRRMANVIEHFTLPYFREDQYEQGILASVDETIKRANPDWVAPATGIGPLRWVLGALGLGVAGWLGLSRFGHKFRRCPQCGRRGLQRDVNTITKPTRTSEGLRDVTTSCGYCAYSNTVSRRVSRIRRSSSGGSFGGGSSSGGGATGRW